MSSVRTFSSLPACEKNQDVSGALRYKMNEDFALFEVLETPRWTCLRPRLYVSTLGWTMILLRMTAVKTSVPAAHHDASNDLRATISTAGVINVNGDEDDKEKTKPPPPKMPIDIEIIEID